MKVIFKKDYSGFESIYDLSRDINEMWEKSYDEEKNKVLDSIPGEFQGTVKVLITYEENDEN